jgi:CheY-like chemotaxis protein
VAPSTVFVVEDDVDTRDMLGRFLELEVILLDLMMPVMDGWQFRRQQVLDSELADIPVIVVSAAGKERMGGIDADAYLSKPVDLEQLLAQVNQYCCG